MARENRTPPDEGDDLADRLPPQATMGLLDYLTSTALDEDYAYVAMRDAHRDAEAGERPADAADTPPPRRRVGLVGALVMAAFAVLVVTAAVQTSRNSVSDQSQRRELAAQVSDARGQVDDERTRLTRLQRQTAALQARQLGNDQSAQGLRDRLELLRVKTGASPVRGEGVRVVANDAPGSHHGPQRGARHRPAATRQRALGGGCRGDLAERPATDQPEHDPAGGRRDHHQRTFPAPAVRPLGDR